MYSFCSIVANTLFNVAPASQELTSAERDRN